MRALPGHDPDRPAVRHRPGQAVNRARVEGVRSLHAAEPQFPGDDGAADPVVLAALAAYAAGRASEHAALDALASSRLLVPVVALVTEEPDGDSGADDAADVSVPGAGLRREKTTEMAMPTLIGRDGRAAVLAFTSLDALTRWRPDARPVAVPAARAWQAGAEEASAVVIDVAGPVPVTVEGARLAALAAGRPAPLPHQDPDVLAALHAALGNEPLIVQASLTTPDQRSGWEYGPRPEDLPDLGARSTADLSALGVRLPDPAGGATGPDAPRQERGASASAAGTGAGETGASADAAAGDGARPGGASLAGAARGGAGLAGAIVGSAGVGSAGVGGAGRAGAGRDRLAPDAIQETAGQDTPRPGMARPGIAQPGTAQPGATRPDTTQQETAGQHTARPEIARPDAAQPGTVQQDAARPETTQQDTAGQDVADLALQVTLAEGCDPAAATAAVRRVAEALLTATGGRLRRGMEISVAPRRAR